MSLGLIQMPVESLLGRAFPYSFTFLLLSKLLLSTYYIWGSVVGDENTILNKNVLTLGSGSHL